MKKFFNKSFDNVKTGFVFLFLSVIFLTLFFFSCKPTLYVPVSSDSVFQSQLIEGRKHYVNRCSSCHNLHLPNEFNGEQWSKSLDEMQEKSGISDTEKRLIYQFLTYRQ